MDDSDGSESAVPFAMVDQWPERLGATVIRAAEAGIILGEFSLPGLMGALRDDPLPLSVRIDKDPQPEDWTTKRPDGTESHRSVVPPQEPVRIPNEVLTDNRTLGEWVLVTHGSLGRLLLWGADAQWWVVNEPDLEATLACGPSDWIASVCGEAEDEPFSWLPIPSAGNAVRAIYGL